MSTARIRPGLTAPEIATVVAVIGILLLVSVPTFSSLRARYQVGGAAKLLSSDLRYAQQRSVTEQAAYGLRLSPALGSYEVFRVGPPETLDRLVTLDPLVSIVSPTGLANDTVTFNAAGAPSASGDVTLRHANGTTVTVSVRPSGYIKTN